MIVKRIKAKKVKDKASHAADLVRYITGEKEGGLESETRIESIKSRGFICNDMKSQIAEMSALASECVRSKNPLNHYILSWREGEHPSDLQVDQALDIFTAQLGLTGCQMIAALHTDTHNRHLHVAINRVDPETLKVREIANGFDIVAAHQAIALIEHTQGWRPVNNARFRVSADGELESTKKSKAQPELPAGAKDFEIRTGEQSYARNASEMAGDVFTRVSSWPELHRELNAAGMRYERVGSGAVVEFEGQLLKASTVSRAASFSKLQKRLGAYQPPPEGINEYFKHKVEPYIGPARSLTGNRLRVLSECRLARDGQQEAESLLQTDVSFNRRKIGAVRRKSAASERARTIARAGGGADRKRAVGAPTTSAGSGRVGRTLAEKPLFEEWQKARLDMKNEKDAKLDALKIEHDLEWKLLKERQSKARKQLLAGKWAGKGVALNAFRAAIKSDQDAELNHLKTRQTAQRKKTRERYKPWPDYQAWLVAQNQPVVVEQLRYPLVELVFIVGFEYREAWPVDLPGYDSIVDRDSVHYRRKGADEIAFTDRGHLISIFDSNDEAVVLDALRVASAKWGSFVVHGDDDYKSLCVRLCAEHGLEIDNPELLPALEAERIALGLQSPAPEKPEDDGPGW